MHGEVRLFAVHGHHLGELLQLKCTGKKWGNGYKSWKIVIDTRGSFAYPVMMRCSSLCSAPSAALSPEITEMPAVSQTHLSVYCFPTAGDERGSYTWAPQISSSPCSAALARHKLPEQWTGWQIKKKKKTAHRAGNNIWRLGACVFKGSLLTIQAQNCTGPSAFRPYFLLRGRKPLT